MPQYIYIYIYAFPHRTCLLRALPMVMRALVLLGLRFPLVVVFSPARARGSPVAARAWLQSLQLSVETFDVPSCLLRIQRVVVLRFQSSLRRIHDRVCASVGVIGNPACCAGHSGTSFIRLLAAAPRPGTAGASACAPRARYRRFLKSRSRHPLLWEWLLRALALGAPSMPAATRVLQRASREVLI